MIRRLTLTIMLAAAALQLSAQQLTATDVFKSAPARVLPLLTANTRLDMLDYFNSGLSTASQNTLQGRSSIKALSDESVTIAMTEASTCQIALLPAGQDRQVIAVISTVATPAPDSKLTLYSSDWTDNMTARTFSRPALQDWLTAEGRRHKDEVEMSVPFLLVEYSLDPKTGLLTLSNNTHRFVSEEIYEMVEPYLMKSIQYKWNGRRFESVK